MRRETQFTGIVQTNTVDTYTMLILFLEETWNGGEKVGFSPSHEIASSQHQWLVKSEALKKVEHLESSVYELQ